MWEEQKYRQGKLFKIMVSSRVRK